MIGRVCWRCLFTLLLLTPLCAPWQPLAADTRAPRLPVKAFFGNPRFSQPQLSPDGKHIAMLISDGDRLLIAVRATEGGTITPIGRISEPRVRPLWLHWANPTRLLVSVQMRDNRATGVRARRHRLFAIDADGKNARFLAVSQTKTGTEEWPVQFEDDILNWPRNDPDHVLIQYRDREFPSVKLLDVNSGRLNSVEPTRVGIHFWHADHDGIVRVGEGYQGVRYALYARLDTKADFEKIEDFDLYGGEQGFRFLGFSFDPAKIYVSKSTDGKRAVYEYDLRSRQLGEAIFAQSGVDAGALVFDEEARKLVAVDYTDDEPRRYFVDDEARREQAAIDHALPGTFNEVVNQSRDRGRAIVLASGDTHPPAYYAYIRNLQPKQLNYLLGLYPDLPADQLAPMRAVSFAARDGVTISGYLTVPKGLEAKHLPVIVHPHGGPSARDYRGFDPVVQYFANRGFAVFQMNFRGSSGYGEQHETSGYRQWGLAMQDDITDGVRWLVAQGIADPDRIGVYGAGYGGYAALMGLVKTPELYRAGASYAGVTSLPAFLSDDQWYLFVSEHERVRIGGGSTEMKRLEENSPVNNAAKIRAPVFLAHGEDDERVHVKHSQMMAKALRDAGKAVEYVEFPHEHHGFLLEENRLQFYERLAEFFEKHLAPRENGGEKADLTGAARP